MAISGDLSRYLIYTDGDLRYTFIGKRWLVIWKNRSLEEKYTMRSATGRLIEAISMHFS